MTSPAIRSATTLDLPLVLWLLTDSNLPVIGVRESITDFVVAEANGQLVGVAGLEMCRENALLRSLAVALPWRNKDIGRSLVTRVIANAESRGVRGLYLLTTTAERYFPPLGFREIARGLVPADVRVTEEFTSACPATATVMTRPLGASAVR